jgi:hypothetical protein
VGVRGRQQVRALVQGLEKVKVKFLPPLFEELQL